MQAILSGQPNVELLVFAVIAEAVVLYYTYGWSSSKSHADSEAIAQGDQIYDEWIYLT
jgi:hypothetical protein